MQKLDFPFMNSGGSLSAPERVGEGVFAWVPARVTDRTLLWIISSVLFAITAWPLLTTEVPPYQDLPNHLAAAHILWHPSGYPEFVANGFFKTNAALFTWLYLAGKVFGLALASRLFAAATLLVGAIVYPKFLYEFGGRARLIVGSFFLWPMIHNWFVSKGMLDFAMGVPLSLMLLILLRRQVLEPSARRGFAIAALALAAWYAHVFSLLVSGFLIVVHLIENRETRVLHLRRVFLPMLPASLFTAVSVVRHWTEPTGAMSGFVDINELSPPWELVYNLWAEWCAGFTWYSIASLLAVVGGLWGMLRWTRVSPVFFSPIGLLSIVVLYFVLPYTTTNWFHVNSRVIPYVWMALLLRLPDRIPSWLQKVCVVGAATYSLGMGVDFVRLDHDRELFTSGMQAVPEGARLLPLVFRPKETSENTRSLMHAWGHYVIQRNTSAPLLFAHSRSFPVMYREPPPPRFNHLILENFASTMGNETWMCKLEQASGIITNDCRAEWSRRWTEFWDDARPRFDHVLMWAPPKRVLEEPPPGYRLKHNDGKLYIYERIAVTAQLVP
jgi:hypothetical protein